jgi:poly [ADP-ribose] polymerase
MKWGRIGGDTGGSTKSSVGGLASAKAVWADKYLDKTGNKWDDREKFVKKPGKYFPQEIVDDDDGEDENKKKGDGNGNYDDSLPQYDDADVIPSYLDPRVQDIMRLIFDTDLMRQTMIDLELDVRKMPLGKISKQQITKGYEFLRQIEQVLSSNDESKTFKLSQLTNQFYTLIPHDFGLKRPDNIDNHIILKRKMQQLETLLDLQIAASLLHDEAAELTRTHPLDRHYQMLNINMAPLNKYSREYKTIIKYVTNGHSPSTLNAKLTVMDAFRIERDGERERFVAARYDQVRPRKLLWHGSRVANYVGILSQGLRIAPPEAPMTGYLLGKGVYLADMVEKSAAFCHPSPNNRTGLLLLCDTAVGETYDIKKPEYVTELPDGKLATHALSKIIPDPTKNEVGDDKVIIPVGPPIPSGLPDVFLQHSEFVVYKPEQIQIRYLVKVRFDDVAQSQ